MLALTTASVALLAPTSASACDLDGFGGMHRLNPFGAMGFGRGMPVQPPASDEAAPTRTEPTANRSHRSAKEKTENQPTPPRKWEQQGDGAPITREDAATFT